MRFWHASVLVRNKVLVYSGSVLDYSQRKRLASVVELLDPYSERWETKRTDGESPALGVWGTAFASANDDLFMFGGTDSNSKRVCDLHRLDTKTYRWCKLSPRKGEESPMPKFSASMIAYGDNIAITGGHGLPQGPIQPGSSFLKDTKFSSGSGWTNEFHVYNHKKGVWSSPTTTGERPPPCDKASFTSIDHKRAVMFGGFNRERSYMSDVYILDLQSMHWTKLHKPDGVPWPEERSGHSACCLNYDQQHPQLLVTGGRRSGKILKDAWILDVDSGRWKKVTSDMPQPRRGHTTTAFSLSPGLTEVTMFGGSSELPSGKDATQSKLAATTILQFRLKEGSWELTSMVRPTELGRSVERLREKMETLEISTQKETPQDGASDKNEASPPKKVIEYEVDLADLEFGELLGRGGFGAVFQGRWRSKGFDVALKKVNITPDESDAKTMMELGKHPNIISFYGFAYNYPETVIVTALAKKGSLFDYLHTRKEKPTQQQSLTWAKQIAYGMAHMHLLDYVHRDLKSSNILFSNDMVAQVSDFGTARFLKATTLASKIAGTLRWMAPEVANDDAINKQCDVFSFSLVVWELMEHNVPYPEARTDVKASFAIISGQRPPIGATWPAYLSSLTQACWAHTPNDRPTFSDIVTSFENETYFRQ